MKFHPTSNISESVEKNMTLIRAGKDCELDPENSELVGSQIVRQSERIG